MHVARDVAMLGSSGYERVENDFYETPAWCTAALLRWVRFDDVWEPAAGNGAITDVLKLSGYDVLSMDLVRRDGHLDVVGSFLDIPKAATQRDIVTNPPYKEAEAFVRKALALTAEQGGKVAMLMRHEFDCALSRMDLFENAPFALKIVLTRRPRWFAGSTGAPRHNYAWYVWDWKHRGPAQLAYDNGGDDARDH